jgi:uncharacterized protein
VSATAFPLTVDGRGRSAAATDERHVRDLVEAVLLTSPGERVNRPDFGCGLAAFLFAPVDAAIAGTAEVQVRSGLQRWLGDVIDVAGVEVELDEGAVRVTVDYRLRATGVAVTATFEQSA